MHHCSWDMRELKMLQWQWKYVSYGVQFTKKSLIMPLVALWLLNVLPCPGSKGLNKCHYLPLPQKGPWVLKQKMAKIVLDVDK